MSQSPEAALPAGERILPYRAWWGLVACAVFMGLVYAFAPYTPGFSLEPDRGNFWYFWQRSDPSAWTRLSAWIPYTVHQISIWYLIAQARHARPRYVLGLHCFNVWALGINAFFLLLHIAQTKLFYDGLAQDVHEATSMGSVVLMLWLILLMENRRRGLFFGKPVALLNTAGDAVRRYHGYYFSWAIIYTFWYHPVEMTPGHLAGFAYMALLLLQSSLFFTRFHVNRWWTMFLETLFVVHGAFVAWYIMNPGDHRFWSMFLFGGIGLFLLTQMHGLGLSTRGKWAVALPLIGILVAFYSQFPETVLGLPRLAVIQYIGTFLMAGTVMLLIGLGRWLGGQRGPGPADRPPSPAAP